MTILDSRFQPGQFVMYQWPEPQPAGTIEELRDDGSAIVRNAYNRGKRLISQRLIGARVEEYASFRTGQIVICSMDDDDYKIGSVLHLFDKIGAIIEDEITEGLIFCKYKDLSIRSETSGISEGARVVAFTYLEDYGEKFLTGSVLNRFENGFAKVNLDFGRGNRIVPGRKLGYPVDNLGVYRVGAKIYHKNNTTPFGIVKEVFSNGAVSFRSLEANKLYFFSAWEDSGLDAFPFTH